MCIICGCRTVHKHHLELGPNRNKAEEDGLWCYLCPEHHNMSNAGVHNDPTAMKWARLFGELAWINHFHPQLTREEQIDKYRKRYGHNYL